MDKRIIKDVRRFSWKKLGIVDIRKGLMFAFVFFLTLLIALWLSRKKKGKRKKKKNMLV